MIRALATLVLVTATTTTCTQPALDTTGMIHCGGADSGMPTCPAGDECRWGLCCPTGASLDQCPGSQLPPDTTGAYVPIASGSFAGDCPPGYDVRLGYCCPSDAGVSCPAGVLGAPCTSATDCTRTGVTSGTPTCVQNLGFVSFSAGYCAVQGCSAGACGPNGVCETLANQSYCVRSCTLVSSAATCSAITGNAYECIPSRSSGGAAFCFPSCANAAIAMCSADYVCAGTPDFCRYRCWPGVGTGRACQNIVAEHCVSPSDPSQLCTTPSESAGCYCLPN